MSSGQKADASAAAAGLPAAGSFSGGVHHYPLRVYFEDTDAGGVVYHASYLRFMERARTEMLRALGIEHKTLLAEARGYYAVSDAAVRYLAPARIDDCLVVSSRVAEVRAAACVIAQDVARGTKLLSTGRVTAVFLSPAGRPRRQEETWRRSLLELAGLARREEDRSGD